MLQRLLKHVSWTFEYIILYYMNELTTFELIEFFFMEFVLYTYTQWNPFRITGFMHGATFWRKLQLLVLDSSYKTFVSLY